MNGTSQLPFAILGGTCLFFYWAAELLFSTTPLNSTPL